MNLSYTLVAVINDFYIDGFQILRTKDINLVEHGEIEMFLETIFLNEGIEVDKQKLPVNSISSMENIFYLLKSSNSHVIIENESENDCFFYIGIIVEVAQQYVDILPYNEMGVFDSDVTQILFDDITCIIFDCNYTNVMSKYAH